MSKNFRLDIVMFDDDKYDDLYKCQVSCCELDLFIIILEQCLKDLKSLKLSKD